MHLVSVKMLNLKLSALIVCVILSACTFSNSSDQTKLKTFDQQMDKAKKYCLEKGFVGHEPEYRSCVIIKSSEIFNLNVTSNDGQD